jgi:hypothetical protein
MSSRYQTQQSQIEHWYKVCKVQYPIYQKYWKGHPDLKGVQSLMPEQVFAVPYKLPSGRVVLLRGKWDDAMGIKRPPAGIYLRENKTKGEINEQQIQRQVGFDLQTGVYLVALHAAREQGLYWFAGKRNPPQVRGTVYNVIRRPLSGGKGSITRHKEKTYTNKAGGVTKRVPEETEEHFYNRVGEVITENADTFFMRWKVTVSQADLVAYQIQYLDPHLESLYDWWEHITECGPDPFARCQRHGNPHWRTPYGFWSPLAEGRTSELDEYLATGSMTGLVYDPELYPELRE